MSSVRGGGFRGGGRGSMSTGSTSRGSGAFGSSNRNNPSTTSSRGGSAFGQPSRSRGSSRPTRGGHATAARAFGGGAGGGAGGRAHSKGSWQERYQVLTKARERERAEAIRQGLIAVPEKPRLLSEAVTPVGTCQDMCAEYERVERVVQKDVWPEETDPNQSVFGSSDNEPDESRMVKKFRRAAAGLEEQLPSDLRPPHVLKATCDYLFETVIGNALSLGQVHHFVWDRTRAIRNDFSIQQLTKPEELSIAVECYERIARFHVLSLHVLALPEKPYSKYDWQQEREQLDRTLLSLMQYYDDSRGRIELKNEAEFRAYCVIFQLQDPTPDLEDRIQTWPASVIRDSRVQRALEVYMAACNVLDAQGPLKPRATHLIARQDWQRFWDLIASKKVSYLMACVAEIYFNLVRRTVLNALFRTFRPNSSVATPEWTVSVLCDLLAFDEGDQVYHYCELFGFSFKETDDGEHYLDLSSVRGRVLPEPSGGLRKQAKTDLVENKRYGRTLPAVINGMSVVGAQAAGMVEEEEEGDGVGSAFGDDQMISANGTSAAGDTGVEDADSLFVPETTISNPFAKQTTPSAFPGFAAQANPQLPTFGSQSGGCSFGKPTTVSTAQSTANNESIERQANSKSPFGAAAPPATSPFNFLKGPTTSTTQDQPAKPAPSTGFSFLQAKPASNAPEQPTAKSPIATPLFDFKKGTDASGGQGSTVTPPAPLAFSFTKLAASPFEQKPTTQVPLSSFGTSSGLSGLFNAGNSQVAKPIEDSALSKKAEETEKQPSPFSQSADSTSIFANPQAQTQLSSTVKPFCSFQTPTPTTTSVDSVETAKQTQSPPSGFGFPAPGPKQSQSSPGPPDPPEANRPPLHFTSSPSPSSPPAVGTNQTSNATAGLKRPSFSSDTRPKKPSPLANSITAEEEATASHQVKAFPTPSSAQSPQAPSSPGLDAKTTSPEIQKKAEHATPGPPKEDFDTTLTRLARELTNDPIAGYLRQFIEHTVGKTITSVQAQLTRERNIKLADEFRHWTLSRKFGKRWIKWFWRRKLANTGRERRQRRRRALETGFNDESSVNSESSRGSVIGYVAGKPRHAAKSEKAAVDEMFRHTATREERPFMVNHQTEAAKTKCPASSHSIDALQSSREISHKRLKSTGYVDDGGRITKPRTTKPPNTDILSRSSFLGFSLSPESRSIKSTTKSNYFRLKALGVPQTIDAPGTRGTKRRYSQSEMTSSRTSSPAPGPRLSYWHSEEPAAKALQLTSPNVAKSVADEDDDALFARLKAARDMLNEGAAFFKSEIAKEEEFRKSNNSESSHESPSLARARAEARLIAYQASSINGTSNATRDVPAYRLRESRFVPREQYGKAIKRAKEMRESRSREVSRPESRAEADFGASFIQSAPLHHPQPHRLHSSFSGLQNNQANGFNFASNDESQNFGSTYDDKAMPSGQDVNFSNHNTPVSPSNPFLNHDTSSHGPAQTSFGVASTHQQETPSFDHTIQPSQIPNVLSNSFGAPAELSQPASWSWDNTVEETQSTLQDSVNESHELHREPHTQIPDSSEGFATQNNHAELLHEINDTNDLDHTFGHANPFAALADGDQMEEDESQEASQYTANDEYDDEHEDYRPNGFGSGEEEDEDEDRALYDDDDDDDGEEGDDFSEEENDEDEGPWHGQGPGGRFGAQAHLRTTEPKYAAFNGAGNTAEQAIELSDSD